MRIPIDTNYEPIIVGLKVKTNSRVPLRVRVRSAYYDENGKIAYKPNTDYTNRVGEVEGERQFWIRLPKTPELVVAEIYNAATNNPGEGEDGRTASFHLIKKEIHPLPTYPWLYDNKNDTIKRAMNFIQDFAENQAIWSAGEDGSVYRSDCGEFRIDHLDTIRDRKTGLPLATPARISQDRGIIETAKDKLIKYPVNQTVPILGHEIGHFYLNDNARDESEADMNAVKIALGYGYGPMDVENAFLQVFKGTPSDQNKERYQTLHNFIMDFDKKYNKYK